MVLTLDPGVRFFLKGDNIGTALLGANLPEGFRIGFGGTLEVVAPHGVDRVMAADQHQLVDVLVESEPVGTEGVAHTLVNPTL